MNISLLKIKGNGLYESLVIFYNSRTLGFRHKKHRNMFIVLHGIEHNKKYGCIWSNNMTAVFGTPKGVVSAIRIHIQLHTRVFSHMGYQDCRTTKTIPCWPIKTIHKALTQQSSESKWQSVRVYNTYDVKSPNPLLRVKTCGLYLFFQLKTF